MTPLYTRPPVPVSTTVEITCAWTQDVASLLGQDGLNVAFSALRAVLQTLHRELRPGPSEILSASLPTLLRGVYHAPLDGAERPGARAGFLASVDRFVRHSVRPEEAVRAVCTVLSQRLPADAWRAVRDGLPEDVVSLLAVPPHPERTRLPSFA